MWYSRKHLDLSDTPRPSPPPLPSSGAVLPEGGWTGPWPGSAAQALYANIRASSGAGQPEGLGGLKSLLYFPCIWLVAGANFRPWWSVVASRGCGKQPQQHQVNTWSPQAAACSLCAGREEPVSTPTAPMAHLCQVCDVSLSPSHLQCSGACCAWGDVHV